MFCGKAINAVTRPLFRDSNSKRGGILMHSKVRLAGDTERATEAELFGVIRC